MAKPTNRCWPGYTPVPGKKKQEQGSCRPEADSKLTSGERTFLEKRQRQLDRWEEAHPGKSRSAAQHLGKPAKRRSTKKAAKRSAKRTRT